MFPELAFIKFSVVDSNNNHVISQRIVPIKCIRQGYRHIRLRNLQNIPLEMSSLFLYTEQRIEHVQNLNISSTHNIMNNNNTSNTLAVNASSGDFTKPQMKHKFFKVTIYGFKDEEDEHDNGIVVKVTQDTTVLQVIEQALVKVDKQSNESKDYVLVEEMEHGWASVDNNPTSINNSTQNQTKSTSRHKGIFALLHANYTSTKHDDQKLQRLSSLSSPTNKDIRILQNHEKIMEAQNKWTGNGKFIIKNKSTFIVSKSIYLSYHLLVQRASINHQ